MDRDFELTTDDLDLHAEYPTGSEDAAHPGLQSDGNGRPAPTDVTFTLNGEERTFTVRPDTPLLYVLRNEAEVNGPKFGCGLAQCGACTVVVDGQPRISCVTPVETVAGTSVTTLKGMASGDDLHPIQEAFIEEQAAQCGYCIPGMIMRSYAFLQNNSDPSRGEIKQALSQNLCRCGTHMRILQAVESAAENMTSSSGQGQTTTAAPDEATPETGTAVAETPAPESNTPSAGNETATGTETPVSTQTEGSDQ